MAVGYQHPRGTRAALNALATGGNIIVGQVYVITDEGRLAVGLTTSTYEVFAKASETGGGGGAAWDLLASVSPTNSPYVEVTGISTDYNHLRIEVAAGVHNNGSATSWGVWPQQRSNGAWLSVLAGLSGASISNAQFANGYAEVSGINERNPTMFSGCVASNALQAAPSFNGGVLAARNTTFSMNGGISGLRIGPGSGNITGGTIRVWGAK